MAQVNVDLSEYDMLREAKAEKTVTVVLDESTFNAFNSFSQIGWFEKRIFKHCLESCYDKGEPEKNIFLGEIYESLCEKYGETEIFHLYCKWLDLGLGNFGISERRMWLEPEKFFGGYRTIFEEFDSKK